MRFLLDTSVLVAAMLEAHPKHALALPWLQRAREKVDSGLVAAHSIAELYAVLTTLPVRPRISAAVARELIKHNVLEILEVVPLSAEDYEAVIERLAELGITGGATYDALVMQAATSGHADQLVTLNPADFQRVAPDLAEQVISPGS